VRLAQDGERKLTERGSGGPDGGLVNRSRGIPCALKKCAARTRWGQDGDKKLTERGSGGPDGRLIIRSRGIPCALKKCAARTKWGKEVDGARLRGSRWWPCQ
jgi:hypothetical protein